MRKINQAEDTPLNLPATKPVAPAPVQPDPVKTFETKDWMPDGLKETPPEPAQDCALRGTPSPTFTGRLSMPEAQGEWGPWVLVSSSSMSYEMRTHSVGAGTEIRNVIWK